MLTTYVPNQNRIDALLNPKIVAVFSFRYDAHLVPDLIENIRPMVDGWISWDDRQAGTAFTPDNLRRKALIQAAFDAGAHWVLGIDPDERLERGAATRLRTLARLPLVRSWVFNLREMYAPDAYRIDGVWGRKRQARLFRLMPDQFPIAERGSFETAPLHQPWVSAGWRQQQSGLNLYHLKMIAPQRRQARSDLYNALDPERRYQRIGYDYLADEAGMQLERIPAGREYLPMHRDDEGLWMARPETVTKADRL